MLLGTYCGWLHVRLYVWGYMALPTAAVLGTIPLLPWQWVCCTSTDTGNVLPLRHWKWPKQNFSPWRMWAAMAVCRSTLAGTGGWRRLFCVVFTKIHAAMQTYTSFTKFQYKISNTENTIQLLKEHCKSSINIVTLWTQTHAIYGNLSILKRRRGEVNNT